MRIKFKTVVTRPDGRPEAYMMPRDQAPAICEVCLAFGNRTRYRGGEIALTSPVDCSDGKAHLVCLNHLPENIVIYDPVTKKCRDKSGQNVWEEKIGDVIPGGPKPGEPIQ